MVGMSLDKSLKFSGRTTLGQRTGGIGIGNEDFLLGAEYLAGFAHEVDAAHHNDVGTGLGGLLSQSQRVAYKVGYILNGTVNIVVGQNDGILFFGQTLDALLNIHIYILFIFLFLNTLF